MSCEFKRGEQLALPYFDQRATDLTKQTALSDAYRRYREGELDADELPDLSDIYPDDAALRARMGLQTEPDASAEDALIQACGACHNNVLDQSIRPGALQHRPVAARPQRARHCHRAPEARPLGAGRYAAGRSAAAGHRSARALDRFLE
jgi:hypothetical protein